MAKTQGVWGIDIGQCAVKALRCLPGEEPGTIIADAFDYIEYPKILSQPESNPEELIAEALQQFLSRNQVKGDRVAISVAGQSGLARFVKLPPVEVKKIPDLVRYEARNQIPFDLDEVIWDYQQMGGGMIEEGFAIDVEMGLFAMKREQVEKNLAPFDEARIEVDVVQLTPLALYNFAVFDQMQGSLPEADLYDPENPPESIMILSLGTETTDLVISDGFRVWQRSLPIGGSHFTKALTKELKQTFAKAEHVKRNAAQAENPKALFQAMRPIFADLVTEVQRSMNFFSNVHKKATIGSGIALGSTGKLPGLVRFLSQNLKMPITRVESFPQLRGPGIVDAPAFQENMLAFPVCYGLCLQGLGVSAIQTNLIPREMLVDRMIRAKKPWAAGALAALTLGLTISFAGYWQSTLSVRETDEVKKVESEAKQQLATWTSANTDFANKKREFDQSAKIGENLVLSREKLLRPVYLYRAIDCCTPREPLPTRNDTKDFRLRNEIFITSITMSPQKRELAQWYAEATAPPPATDGPGVPGPAGGVGAGPVVPGNQGGPPGAKAPPATTAATTAAAADGPKGTGYVITIRGYHFHNVRASDILELGISPEDLHKHQGAGFLREHFLSKLEQPAVELLGPDFKPVVDAQTKVPIMVKVKELGIAFPTITSHAEPDWNAKVPNPFHNEDDKKDAAEKGRKEKELDAKVNPEEVFRYNFEVQFALLDAPPPPPAGANTASNGGSVTPAATPPSSLVSQKK
jgi:type IV pilus assembly protein PilM